jgi:hypothetical protein
MQERLARRRRGPERREEERAVGYSGDDAGRNGARRSAPLASAATMRGPERREEERAVG